VRWVVALAAAGLCLAPSASRADEASACARAYEHGQQLRMAGRLSAAAKELATCVADCPAVLAKDCRTWQGELVRETPKLTVRVLGSDGCEAKSVRLRLDDERESFGPGQRIDVDPGKHKLTALPLQGAAHDEVFSVSLGEDKALDVLLDGKACNSPGASAPIPPAESPAATRPTPVLTWILGGVGVAAVGAFAGFGAWGLSQRGDLDDRCKPSCPGEDVDAMYRTYLVADISLAIGVVALAAASIVYLTRPSVPATRSADAASR
jgi:hypothetical protein